MALRRCYCNIKCVPWTYILGIFSLIAMSISVVPYAFYIKVDDDLNSRNLEFWYSILEFPVFLIDILKVLFMLIITLIIKSEWSTKYKTQGETLQEQFESLIKHYTHTGIIVSNLQNIFKYWFILNWMTFFINMVFNALNALKSLMNDEQLDSIGLWIYGLLLLFDSFAFSPPYICGNAMINYHVKYLSELKEKQKVILCDATLSDGRPFWLVQCANIIPQRDEYRFIPSIMWVDVPLDSPGYILSILLALFSLLTHFLF